MSRLFGDTEVATTPIGEVTQGIGFEQLPVQEQSIVNPTRMVNNTIGTFETTSTQAPTGLGSAGVIIVNYGAGGSTSGNEFTVSAGGDIVANPESLGIEYRYRIGLRMGRTGAGGISVPLIRFLYSADGNPGSLVQVGGTFSREVDNANTIWREVFDLNFAAAIGSLIRIEFARDESGSNSGDIQANQPTGTLSGWNPVASARLDIIRQDLV